MNNNDYQVCTRCVMDTTDPNITFDEKGFCNHCTGALTSLKKFKFNSDVVREERLRVLVDKIKREGKNKKYDCIIGLSGGVDSSYLAYIVVKQLGLRPLAVHVDNGWNTELAVMNIENIVKRLNIDLFTWVIDWEEFRDLQKAYLKASVLDIEVLTDNAIVIAIERLMKRFGIKWFLIGYNYQAESIMPSSWLYSPKYDGLNIRSIYRRFGTGKKLRTFPTLGLFEYIRYRYFNRKVVANILDMVPYRKSEVIPFLEQELGWRDYGGKHFESRMTHFYQTYILPIKFKIDKRRAHLSSLIISGQITRYEAILELAKPFSSETKIQEDLIYFTKKLGLTEYEFHSIMNSPPVAHSKYRSYNVIFERASKILNIINGSKGTNQDEN